MNLFVNLISKVVQPVLNWFARVVFPAFWSGLSRFALWLWNSAFGRAIQWLWTHVIKHLFKPLITFLAFFWRQIVFVLTWISDKFRALVADWIFFVTKVRLSILKELLKPFYGWLSLFLSNVIGYAKYIFLGSLIPALYALLDSWGFNLFVEIVRYILLASSKVVGFVIDLIFGLVNFEDIVTNFNEALNALPPCVLELMFAVGLNECLNSLVLTCVVLITVRFILFVWRR